MATISNVSVFNPTQISGCALWLDAADSSSVIQSGGAVSQWNDKSGNGRNAIQATSSNQPTYNNSFVTFNGSSQFMISPLTASSNTETVFAVVLLANNINQFNTILGPNAGPAGGRQFVIVQTATTTFRFELTRMNQAIINQLTITQTAGTMFLTNYINNGSSSTLFRNGASLNTSVTPTAFTGSFTTSIGSRGVDLNANFFGNMYEIIVYNNVLSDNQRQQVEGYLAWKWNLQANLPSSHPYYYNPAIPNLILPTQVATNSSNNTLIVTDPRQISGCALWLDAADSTSVIRTGNTVTAWNDKSGNGRNATASGSVQYITDSQNRNTIYINNSQGFNLPSFVPSATNQLSVFCVINQLTTVGAGNVDLIRTSNYANFTMNLNVTTNFYTLYINNGSTTSATTFSVNNNTAICELVFNVNSGSTFANGSNTTNFSATAGTALTTSQTFVIGTQTTINMNYYELVFFSTALTISQRQQIEGYLAWKWGLQANLPQSHPYYYNPLIPNLVLQSQLLSLTPYFFNPRVISGCALWLDAADSSTVIQSGGAVSQWNDKSGNNNFASNAVIANQPIYVTSSAGNYISFNAASSQFLAFANPNNLVANTTFTVMFVEKRQSSTQNYIFGGTGVTNNQNLHLGYLNNTNIRFGFYGNDLDFSPFPSYNATNEPTRIFGFDYNGSTRSIIANGSILITGSNTTNLISYVGGSIGRYYTQYYTGNVYEALIFKPSISTAQRQQIEGYLAWKWGLQSNLPSSHPFILFPPG